MVLEIFLCSYRDRSELISPQVRTRTEDGSQFFGSTLLFVTVAGALLEPGSPKYLSGSPAFFLLGAYIQTNEGVVSKETVVLRRWGSSIQKFGSINGVDKCKLATVQRF